MRPLLKQLLGQQVGKIAGGLHCNWRFLVRNKGIMDICVHVAAVPNLADKHVLSPGV